MSLVELANSIESIREYMDANKQFKRCSMCRQLKPLSAFHRSTRYGRSSYCKECKKKYSKQHYNDEDVKNRYKNVYRQKQKMKIHNLRVEAMRRIAIDGRPKCLICGIDDIETLEIDHINDDGIKDRRNKISQSKYYNKLLNMPIDILRENYGILCILHNQLKRYGIMGEHYKVIKI